MVLHTFGEHIYPELDGSGFMKKSIWRDQNRYAMAYIDFNPEITPLSDLVSPETH